jgi:hypothetical protein
VENKQAECIDIIKKFCLWEIDTESMHETDGADPPRDMLVHEENRHDEETGTVMNEKCFLADSLCAIDRIFDNHIVDVEDP